MPRAGSKASFYLDALRLALQAISVHKLRAFLTLIGIIIGVASVVVVGASISGLNSYVLDRVSKLIGVNHFLIARIAHTDGMTEDEYEEMDRRNKPLEWDDLDVLIRRCQTCTAVGATSATRVDLEQDGVELPSLNVVGVTANMAAVEDKTISDGRFIESFEVERSMPVAVLGYDVVEKFFLGRDPIGKTVKIQGQPYTVVGVEAKRGTIFGQSMDNHLYVPLTTFEKQFGRRRSLDLHGKTADRENFQAALDEAKMGLRLHHKLKSNEKDDFGIATVDQINSDVDQFTGAIALVVTPVTLISLVVGGIVVMNIMLVSVTERTFEIGLRKALGARRSHILVQFLIESAILAAVGGVFGLLLAAGIAAIVGATTPIPMTITIGYVVLSLAFSGGIGIVAGLYPAIKAARLDPIVALARGT